MGQDAVIVLRWWIVWLVVGGVGWPLARNFFRNWEDQGYLFAKIVGLAGISWGVWVLGMIKLVPFTEISIWIAAAGTVAAGWILSARLKTKTKKPVWWLIAAEEILWLAALAGWSWVKAHEPSINGLEKFMDFGFAKSILHSTYFPPADMWFAGEPINYYYFGHLMMAVATKISGIDLAYTFNLMLGTILALCATMSFAIGRQLLRFMPRIGKIGGAILIAYLVTFSGNLHTIYAFTKGYAGSENNPPPFWTIFINVLDPTQRKLGWNAYWYPNATRFIPYTIHEFPSYSFVVSDIHGHVLGIPLALLAIALLVNMFGREREEIRVWEWGGYGVLAGWMFMTNALDGPIYLGMLGVLTVLIGSKSTGLNLKKTIINLGLVAAVFAITTAPFLLTFKSFVSGIAVDCPPARLANSKIGPFLFEGAEKCQKSPLWMMLVLWGFFVYGGVALLKVGNETADEKTRKMLRIWSLVCLGLIIFPEFFYFKDIYPMHFRSNTMFKLGYQVFMMMSIATGYVIVQALHGWKKHKMFLGGLMPLMFLVSIYPLFSVKSYFGELTQENYKGLYGLTWLQQQLPEDAQLIAWIEKNIPQSTQPVVLEANGDSYTTSDRISTFTGLPTVAGWTVHEWLWRGGYGPIADRAAEVQTVYESENTELVKEILSKYKVKYIVVGGKEREKYPNLNEQRIAGLGKLVFRTGSTSLYELN